MYQEKTIIVQGIPTSYRNFSIEKDKPITLLLHGWGSNKESFSLIQKQITNSVSVDMPGFGKTPQAKEDWSVCDYAMFINEFILKIGSPRIKNILGHSFGGRVAIEGLSQNIFTSDSLCLTGTPIVRETVQKKSFMIMCGRILKKIPGGSKVREYYYKNILGVEDYIDAEKSGMKKTFTNVINKEAILDLEKVTIPVLLLWGEKDATIDIRQAYVASKNLKHSTVELVSGGDHFAFVDNPSVFVAKYNNWLHAI